MEQNQSHSSRDGGARDVEKVTSSDGVFESEDRAKEVGVGQKLKDGWSSLDLDIGTLMMMFK